MENDKVFILAILIGFLSVVGACSFNQYAELKSMERNIESAIVKGIDPIAVRCAYKSQDPICSIYASKSK